MKTFLKYLTPYLLSIKILLVSSASQANTKAKLLELPSDPIQKLIQRYNLSLENLNYSLVPIGSSEALSKVSYRENAAFIPASILKSITIHEALKTLGETKTFQTRLKYRGEVVDKTLKGDILLIGGGDPFLTYSQLINLNLKLKKSGIESVEGRFLYDDSLFPVISPISTLGFGDQTYNPGLSALSLEFNQFKAYFNNNNWQTIPNIDQIKITTSQKKFLPGKRFSFNKKNENELWKASEQQNYQRINRLPLRNPSQAVGLSFRLFADKLGLSLPLPQKISNDVDISSFKLLSSITSKPLKDLASSTMEFSNNLFAEKILLHWFLVSQNKKPKSLEEAGEALLNELKKKYTTVSFDNWKIKNGSGLTTDSKVTALAFSQLLKYWWDSSFGEVTFPGLLSLSGHNGSLARRLDSPDFALRVFSKTGTLDYVTNLSGYLITKNKNIYAFTLSINDLEKRKHLNNPKHPNNKRLITQARQWNSLARDLSDEILKYWISTL